MDAKSSSESDYTTDTEPNFSSGEDQGSEVEEEEKSANSGSLELEVDELCICALEKKKSIQWT